jgi:hypothetical protein|tara:strand:- start:986 stop:1201 length:216 start_codon:yes stop_codon:yes gene_type:complete
MIEEERVLYTSDIRKYIDKALEYRWESTVATQQEKSDVEGKLAEVLYLLHLIIADEVSYAVDNQLKLPKVN